MARDKTPEPRGPFPRITNFIITSCGCGWAFVQGNRIDDDTPGLFFDTRWQHCGVTDCTGRR